MVRQTTPVALHRYAVLVAASVLLLIAAGALVKSREAGLAVPDWPLSYGSLNPPRWWEIQNVRAEHGHRLVAGTVALLTLGLAVWTWRREPRAWVRRLAWGAVAAVLVQALLGGLTVLLFLPAPVSVSHAGLAQLFLCLVVAVALVTSPWWHRARPPAGWDPGRLAAPALLLPPLVYLQILVGAVMRHTGAGLAIPDFPLAFGGLVPPRLDVGIGIHYAHRLGALLVTAVIVWALVRGLGRRGTPRAVRLPLLLLPLLVGAQIALGGVVVLSARAVLPNTLHVATGGALLAVSLVLALTVARYQALRGTLTAAVSGAPAEGVAAQAGRA